MSLLELQQQISQLPFHERVALMRHLQRSLTEAERAALLLEDAALRLDELQSGAVKQLMQIRSAVQRGQADISAGRLTENHVGLLTDVKSRQPERT